MSPGVVPSASGSFPLAIDRHARHDGWRFGGCSGCLPAASTVVLAPGQVAETWRDPATRAAPLPAAGWSTADPPVRALVWSDMHLGNAAPGRARLRRLVARAAARRPDLVLSGDLADPSLPSELRARLGVVAVPGNHDQGIDVGAVRGALARAGVTVIENEAVRRGSMAIAGTGDAPARHARVDRVRTAIARVGGASVLPAHPPVPGGWRGPVLAGHTHCGQIVLLLGEPARTTIVTAGTGTSVLPFRLARRPAGGC